MIGFDPPRAKRMKEVSWMGGLELGRKGGADGRLGKCVSVMTSERGGHKKVMRSPLVHFSIPLSSL